MYRYGGFEGAEAEGSGLGGAVVRVRDDGHKDGHGAPEDVYQRMGYDELHYLGQGAGKQWFPAV